MKLKNGFVLHDVCGEKVLIAQGIENINFSKMINLNETAAYLWQKAEQVDDFTIETMAQWLTEEYEVSLEQATKDVDAMAQEWLKLGLITN